MQYKTITLGLIQEQPELYESLRSTKRLLPAMDAYAVEMKHIHEEWKEQLVEANPHSDPTPLAAAAMELAIESLREILSCASPASATEPLSLDAAMSFLRPSPHA